MICLNHSSRRGVAPSNPSAAENAMDAARSSAGTAALTALISTRPSQHIQISSVVGSTAG